MPRRTAVHLEEIAGKMCSMGSAFELTFKIFIENSAGRKVIKIFKPNMWHMNDTFLFQTWLQK